MQPQKWVSSIRRINIQPGDLIPFFSVSGSPVPGISTAQERAARGLFLLLFPFPGNCAGRRCGPRAVITLQSFGDFLGFNPHLHVLILDGCFYGDGMFRVAPRFEAKDLEKIFRHKVFKIPLRKGKITEELVNMLICHSVIPVSMCFVGQGYSLEMMKLWKTWHVI